MPDSRRRPGGPYGALSTDAGTDAVALMTGAVRGVLGLGMTVLRTAAEQMGGVTHRESTPKDPAAPATAYHAMRAAASDVPAASAAGTSAQPTPGELLGRGSELTTALAKASLVAASSTFSYCRQLVEVSARHQPGLIAAVGGMALRGGDGAAGEPARRVTEEVRSYFREVGDAAVQEAQHLQAELQRLGEELASATAPRDPDGTYRRRWKAKQ